MSIGRETQPLLQAQNNAGLLPEDRLLIERINQSIAALNRKSYTNKILFGLSLAASLLLIAALVAGIVSGIV